MVKPDIELIQIASLVPYANNPRTHPKANVAKLAESLKQYGWTNPVLITDSQEIIAGHGRVLAASKLGLQEAPCIRLSHLTPEQVKAYRIADNRLGLDSEWDDELLRLELSDIDLDSVLTGFDEAELDRILNGNAGREGEDDTPELQQTAVSQLGEIWILGAHRLLCADSTDGDRIKQLFGGVTPTIMVTDPPYGVEYDPQWRRQIRGSYDDVRSGEYIKNDETWDWSPAFELFDGPVAYVWFATRHWVEVAQSLQRLGFELRAELIWVKQFAPLSRGHYSCQHEPCWYAVRKGKKANWRGKHYESTVIQVNTLSTFGGGSKDPADANRTDHAAQKPVECMRRPILNHTSEGQAVYDPFMGSGTTIIAAETIGRVCYGVEINPLYVDMAIRRWQTFTKQTATRFGDGKPFSDGQAA